MERRTLLKLLAGLPLAALPACSGSDGVTVTISTPTTPTVPPNSTPTPTPTPIPPPELLLSTLQTTQAGAILVSLVGETTGGTVTFLDRTSHLIQGSQSIFAFVAVDADDPPGSQPLRVDFTLANGTKGSLTENIEVVPADWPVDPIELPPGVEELLDPKIVADEAALMSRIYGTFTPEKLWDNMTWLVPTPGPITTQMGEQRSYNGGPASGHHGGTDIGAEEGAPVAATNRGRVVLARQLNIHGNMIVVDHGGGLMSGYAHLSSFAVAEGQLVAGGDTIAYVGNTGLSTGSHLHWEMCVGGVLTDPLSFTDGTNGF